MYSGWYQVAFERDVKHDVTPLSIGRHHLALVRSNDGIHAIDAFCPHRGANLGFGGRLEGDVIVCPFHGRRISWQQMSNTDYCVRRYRTLVVGGLVFTSISETQDNGFEALLKELDHTHFFVPGFSMQLRVAAETVIENAFDNSHFKPVHALKNEPQFQLLPSRYGEFAVSGMFEIPASPWQKARPGQQTVTVPFTAKAYSPGIVLSEMGGENPYFVITSATPTGNNECVVLLSLVMPAGKDGGSPNEEACLYLLRQSRNGLEKDKVIWENRSTTAPSRYALEDQAVVEFQKFCQRFVEEQ